MNEHLRGRFEEKILSTGALSRRVRTHTGGQEHTLSRRVNWEIHTHTLTQRNAHAGWLVSRLHLLHAQVHAHKRAGMQAGWAKKDHLASLFATFCL